MRLVNNYWKCSLSVTHSVKLLLSPSPCHFFFSKRKILKHKRNNYEISRARIQTFTHLRLGLNDEVFWGPLLKHTFLDWWFSSVFHVLVFVGGQNCDPSLNLLNQKLWGQRPSDVCFLTPSDSNTCLRLRITYFDIYFEKNAINYRFHWLVLWFQGLLRTSTTQQRSTYLREWFTSSKHPRYNLTKWSCLSHLA